MDDYERVLLVKPEVFVYRIPPLGSSRGYKAADWKLDNPDFVGRLRLTCRAQAVVIKLEDKASGELFAKCPVDRYPGPAIESVQDSSRYFVLRIMDDSGKTAIIGMGFADRGDSFDLNVTLQDHFKHKEKDDKLNVELAKEAEKPKLDLGFKDGQTITINLGKKSGNSTARPKSASSSSGPFSLPPPPPAGSKVTVSVPSNGQGASKGARAAAFHQPSIDPPSRSSPSSALAPQLAPQQHQSTNPFVNFSSTQGPTFQGTTPDQTAPFSVNKIPSNPFAVQQQGPSIDNLL